VLNFFFFAGDAFSRDHLGRCRRLPYLLLYVRNALSRGHLV